MKSKNKPYIKMTALRGHTSPETGARKPWFSVKNLAGGVSEILIYDEIDPFFGFSAEDLSYELREITASRINVRINSPGGSMFDGIAIYNMFRSHPAEIHTYADAIAASIASVIFGAAEKGNRHIAATGTLMIHNPMAVIAMGDSEKLRHTAETLDKFREIAVGIYAGMTGIDPEAIREMMKAETWMNAEEAVAKGFADDIYNNITVENKNKFALESVFNSVPAHMRGGSLTIKGPIACTKKPDKGENIMLKCPKCGKEHSTEEELAACCVVAAEQPTPAPVIPEPVTALTPEPITPEPVTPAEVPADPIIVAALRDKHDMPAGWAAAVMKAKHTQLQVQNAVIAHLASKQPAHIGPAVERGQDSRDKFLGAARDAFAMRAGMKPVDKDGTTRKETPGASDIRRLPLLRIAEISLREAGHDTLRMDQETIARMALGLQVRGGANYAPSDLPGLFEDTLERRMMESFYGWPVTYKEWTKTTQVSDFRQVDWIKTAGIPSFKRIGVGGTYDEFYMAETTGGWRIHKHGVMFSVFWETIVNDRYDALMKLPELFGMGAALFVNEEAYSLLTGSTLGYDGKVLFDSTHSNTGTAGVPSETTLQELKTLMRRQKSDQGVDGDATQARIMGMSPKFTLAGLNNEKALLRNLNSPTALLDSSGSAVNQNPDLKNPSFGRSTPIIEPLLDGTAETDTAWFDVADPNMLGTMTVGWLNGVESPELIPAEQSKIDARSWRARLCFGQTIDDYRSFSKNAGA